MNYKSNKSYCWKLNEFQLRQNCIQIIIEKVLKRLKDYTFSEKAQWEKTSILMIWSKFIFYCFFKCESIWFPLLKDPVLGYHSRAKNEYRWYEMLWFISSACNYWMNINIMNSNKMSELGNFDKYIEDLMAG